MKLSKMPFNTMVAFHEVILVLRRSTDATHIIALLLLLDVIDLLMNAAAWVAVSHQPCWSITRTYMTILEIQLDIAGDVDSWMCCARDSTTTVRSEARLQYSWRSFIVSCTVPSNCEDRRLIRIAMGNAPGVPQGNRQARGRRAGAAETR
jgi:hypothetical protein